MKKVPPLDSIKYGQKVGIEIDESKSIDMFIKNLYKSKSVMFQEIYSNELTAAMKARERGAKPWIEVTTNLDERNLIVQGCDSLGITPKIFTDIATVLGASGNMDKDKPGMFGVGFAALLGISNTMILSSLPMETKKQYGLIFVKWIPLIIICGSTAGFWHTANTLGGVNYE